MQKYKYALLFIISIICSFMFIYVSAHASDQCVFEVTADEMPPNIVLLLDNGAEMQHPVSHGDFDNSVNYTPVVETAVDVVPNGAAGNGFFNENGYGIFNTGGKYYLVPVGADLELDTGVRLEETGGKASYTWTINDQTIILPAEASTAKDGEGIIDNAGFFRYSKNYLNWLFFYTTPVDLDADEDLEPIYDGALLPDKSRFYYAKKALLSVGKLTSNKAKFAIYNFTSTTEGASSVQPIGDVVSTLGATQEENILDSAYVNNINNMGTVIYSPLAEGLASIGGYIDSNSFGALDETNYCQKSFVIVVSAGESSEDKSDSNQSIPGSLEDFDTDGTDGFGENGPGQGILTIDDVDHTIVTKINGSTYLDDVAHYFYTHDMRVSNDTIGGWQNVITYTVGFKASPENRLFLINTSNNGNGNPNLTDSSHPEYGKYHFESKSADGLSKAILSAVNDIITRTSTFVAPVVPVTRTTSGDKIYMAFFTPSKENFWEGHVIKFGLNSQNEIVDADGQPATWANGAIKQETNPFWTTKDWADTSKSNGISNTSRNIYTYLGSSTDLTDSSNAFAIGNEKITESILGNPTSGRETTIDFIRGADVHDEDANGITSENRAIITGDVLHSEPLVVTYNFADNTSKTMVFFGANDGMLHAVLDQIDPDVNTVDDEQHYGTEAWAFIPPDQLDRLKYILEGTSHRDFVDASPKAYFYDVDKDGYVDTNDGDKVILVCGERKGGSSYFALDITVSDSTLTTPDEPKYLWRIGKNNDSETGVLELNNITRSTSGSFQNGNTLRLWNGANEWNDAALVVGDEFGSLFISYDARTQPFNIGDRVGNLTTGMYADYLNSIATAPFVWGDIVSMTNTAPDVAIPELGESWSEPQYGIVKTTDTDETGTPVFFIGAGYSVDNSAGKAVLAINVFTGEVVRKFTSVNVDTTDMAHTTDTAINYSISSTVKIVDEDGNGFVDKVYVGDLGGNLWRFGKVLPTFPACDENINSWEGTILFNAPSYVVDSTTYIRKFYYPPSVTLERDYDLLFIGTGDREDACSTTTDADRIYCVKDAHASATLTETDLVDVTYSAAQPPDLDKVDGDVDLNGTSDQGWFIRLVNEIDLPVGEKVLAKSTVFNKVLYITTFTPNNAPCLPGGAAQLYAVNYLTGEAAIFVGTDIDGDGVADPSRNIMIGGGIPSKPVMVLQKTNQKLLISVGSTAAEGTSQSLEAGVIRIDPLVPNQNFYRKWWRQFFS